MAIDTRNKRDSAIHLGLPWRMRFPVPDGSLDQADRQHVGLHYSGILAGTPSLQTVPFVWEAFDAFVPGFVNGDSFFAG